MSQTPHDQWRKVTVRWDLHVAVTALIDRELEDGGMESEIRLLDPLLFSEPVTSATWRNQMRAPDAAVLQTIAECFKVEEMTFSRHRADMNMESCLTDDYHDLTNQFLGPMRLDTDGDQNVTER